MTVGLNNNINVYTKERIKYPQYQVNFGKGNGYTLPNDSVEISGKNNKKNSNLSWLITGLLTTALASFAYIKVKKSPPKIKQLDENINFQKFETVGEAVDFAKKNFGIKIEVGNNVRLANFINNRLIVYNNIYKGKIVLPKKIIAKSGMKTIDKSDALMGWSNWGNLYINKELAAKYLDSDNKNDFLYMMKAFYHELGHANHQAVCKNYYKMGNLKELKAMFINDNKYYDEFKKDIKNNKAVKSYCTEYALSSPAEFVADVFADKIMGKNIPNEVEMLYKKYGGRDVPKR